jgi:amino acid adenylation domain-containing protein
MQPNDSPEAVGLSADKLELLTYLLEEEGIEAPQPQAITPRAHPDELPLSFAQQRLWFLAQLEPESPAYNLWAAYRLRGPLNVPALEQSLSEIVRRHEALRTTFAAVDGQPVQVVAPHRPLRLPIVKLKGLPEGEKDARALQLVAEDARRPFDLAQGPLFRATLAQLAEEDYVLLLAMHHIISDGWSTRVLFQELTALYTAFTTGKPSPLPELPVQYADYAVWQRQWLQGEVLETQLAYWKQQLGGSPSMLELPTDHPRPAIQTYRGARQSLLLPEALSVSLKVLSQREEVTLFMTLLAAFQVLLQRYTGQDDIVVGSPIAGRNRAELEGLIGFFVNTLVLRTDLSGDPLFRELLGRVREVALGAYAHQELPFEKLVEELQPARRLSHTPLFQVFFNMLNLQANRIALPGLTVEVLSPPEVESKFDLTLYVRDQHGRIHFDLVYNADLFGRARMVELLAQLQQLLAQVVERPWERIDRFLLVTPEAAARLPDPAAALRAEWAGSVQARFAEQARRVPQRPAVVDPHEVWSYAELEARSNQLAHYLRGQGVQPQEVVAIYGHRSTALVWALLGVLKAGAAFLMLDPAYPAARLRDCLRLAKPRGWIQLGAAGTLPEPLEAFVATVRCRLELPRRTAAASQNLFEGYATADPGIAVAPDDLAYIVFTSGSTGTPKGIRGSHRPLAHFLAWYSQTFGLDDADRFSLLSGLSHDPVLRDLFTPLWLGGTLHIPDPEAIGSPDRLLEWMQHQELSVVHLTPALGQLLAAGPSSAAVAPVGEPRLRALRYACFGGDVLTKQEVAKLRSVAPSATCVNFYGATETPQAMGYFIIPDADAGGQGPGPAWEALPERVPVGQGIADVQLLVLTGTQQLAGIGELGEIYVRTPYLTQGYLDDEALTQARFITNPWTHHPDDRLYRTGDVARYRPDGTVEFLGRRDAQVKLRGFRIELGEIEAVLGGHPAVREAAVVVREDTPGEKQLVAYLVPTAAPAPTTSELRRFLQARLPDYMLPSTFMTLEALPLTPNGKMDCRALPAPGPERPALEDAFAAPRTPNEEMLAGIWTEMLGIEHVGIHDDFFALGGHSLLATQVMSRLRTAFHLELPLRALFEAPTVAELAMAVAQRQAEQAGHDDMASLLVRLEGLSDEEVHRLLADEGGQRETRGAHE